MKRGEILAFALVATMLACAALISRFTPEPEPIASPTWHYSIPPDNELILGLWLTGPGRYEAAIVAKAGPEYVIDAPEGVRTVSRGQEPPMAWARLP